MKLIAEYLDHALSFERLAAHEKNPHLKADFEKQAAAYRKLAAKRAAELGLEPPPLGAGKFKLRHSSGRLSSGTRRN